jgi:aerobic-type carbon monoxide dehydrogenase small subunit (CoxS/CutS family)
MTERRHIELRVNGRSVAAEVEPRVHLADFLREDLNLRGTHLGCEQGVCGACTVLVDGVPMRSCLVLAVQAADTDVMTVEGLANGDELHPLQAAFREHHALQCGFCTPGFLMTTLYLLEQGVDLSDEATAREALSGNLCRCTGYQNIIDAVGDVAAQHAPAGG